MHQGNNLGLRVKQETCITRNLAFISYKQMRQKPKMKRGNSKRTTQFELYLRGFQANIKHSTEQSLQEPPFPFS